MYNTFGGRMQPALIGLRIAAKRSPQMVCLDLCADLVAVYIYITVYGIILQVCKVAMY